MAIFEGDRFGTATEGTVVDWGRAGLSEKPLLAPIGRRHAGDGRYDRHGFDGDRHGSVASLVFLAYRRPVLAYFVRYYSTIRYHIYYRAG